MTIREAVDLFKQHQKGNAAKNTLRSYGRFLEQLQVRFSEKEVVSVSPDDIGALLDECTEGLVDPRVISGMLRLKHFSTTSSRRQG
jgi:site-specific recombinase XerD